MPGRTAAADHQNAPAPELSVTLDMPGKVAECSSTPYQRATALATRTLRIEMSRLGDDAGLVGCASLVLDHVLAPKRSDTALSSDQ